MAAYLDNAATTRPCAECIDAMTDALRNTYGNPSSLHRKGLEAQLVVDAARKQVAAALSCEPERILFTSGATESNNLAIFGTAGAYGKRRKKMVVTAVEHASVRAAYDRLEELGFTVIRVAPNTDGELNAEAFLSEIDETTCLASMMLVNNETGAVLPVRRTFYAAKKKYPQLITHCDAVQGFLKIGCTVNELEADLISISAHKIHGAKGAGALYIRKGVRLTPLLYGGEQEHKLRPGTESVPLIAGFGAAVAMMRKTLPHRTERVTQLRKEAVRQLSAMEGVVIHEPGTCSPYILSAAVRGLRAETLLHFLAEREVYVSSGSACSKGKPSGVLQAFRIPNDLADSTIRISFCAENTAYDIKCLAEGIAAAQQQLIHKR